MSTSKPSACAALILVFLAAILESTQGISFSPQCTYPGYKPQGVINEVSRSRAIKPAKFETSILQQGLEYFNKGSGVTAATLGMIDAIGDVMKAAPQLSAAIGIITVGMGFLSKTPSPQDILDRSFKSVELLSEEVNLMMDQMQDYADAKDLQLEKKIMDNNYRELYDRWHGCVREVNTERTLDCERRAVEALRIGRFHFQMLKEEFEKIKYDSEVGRDVQAYNPHYRYRISAGWWQFLAKECGSDKEQLQCLTHAQVRRLEVGIIPFRDFATLHLFALKTLEASYRAQSINTNKEACAYNKRYLEELAYAGDQYSRYAYWASNWTYIRQYEENDYFGIRNRYFGRRPRNVKDMGGFMATRTCSGNKCQMECTQMFNDNTCTATGGSTTSRKEQIQEKCQQYVNKIKEEVNEFWNENVLGAAKLWEQYGEDAKKRLKATKCRS